PGIKRMPDGSVRFVYVGTPNSRVALVGDFNRWDPYLTPIPESPIHPGVYVTTLRLPPDSQYYRFVVNGRELTDPGNPYSARNGWGEEASLVR
ncbi:MAG: glycoside hydrolase, partial [Spirochaetaceae bacterium]|nr:glycoside hydrolase [Spirochaetaceae bacterium]